MRLRCYSDLHLEFRPVSQRVSIVKSLRRDADVLVLAGDIVCFGDRRDDWFDVFAALCEGWELVIYMPGNHEFYGSNPTEANQKIRDIASKLPNLKVLGVDVCEVIEHQRHRILGCSMWFPRNEEAMFYRHLINDFSQIEDFEPWVYEENKRHQAFLYDNMQAGDIVITHYMPSMLSVPMKFLTTRTNYFFVCPMDDLIEEKKPAVWIHGHGHGKVTYVLGSTLVFANPVGYPGENGELFESTEPSLIELP